MQNVIVILIIVGAVFYVGKNLYNSLRPGASACGCGCSGCCNTGCTSLPQGKKPEDSKK